NMSDPHDPRRSDLPRRLDLEEGSSSGGSVSTWLAALVALIALLGLAIGFNRTEQASHNQSNAPTTTGAAPSEPRPPPPANPAPPRQSRRQRIAAGTRNTGTCSAFPQ